MTKAADIECCKGGSEFSLKSVDGQDGTEEEYAPITTVNDDDDHFDNLVIGIPPNSLTKEDLTKFSVIDVIMAE